MWLNFNPTVKSMDHMAVLDKLVRTYRGVGEHIYNSTIKEKVRKGYTELQVAAPSGTPVSVTSGKSLEQIALAQIEHRDAGVSELIKFLVAQNRHQIEVYSGGNIKMDISGVVRTVTGDVLTTTAVRSAMTLLDRLYTLWVADPKSTAFYTALSEYLTLIPQQVSRSGWDTLLAGTSSFQTQRGFLDQLLGSAEMLCDHISKQCRDQRCTPYL